MILSSGVGHLTCEIRQVLPRNTPTLSQDLNSYHNKFFDNFDFLSCKFSNLDLLDLRSKKIGPMGPTCRLKFFFWGSFDLKAELSKHSADKLERNVCILSHATFVSNASRLHVSLRFLIYLWSC